MNILYLIVARGGSKSIPGKNLRKLGGLSLIGYKAISARKSKYCSRLMISTDSQEIQAEAISHGVEAPFTRPAELATDSASVLDTIRHAMDWLEASNDTYDAFMLLEPTSPFATAADYDKAVEMMIRENANVVVGVREMEVNSVFVGPMDDRNRLNAVIDKLVGAKSLNRQDQRTEYTMNGCLYLVKWDYFRRDGVIYGDRESTYGYVMDRIRSIEIDEPIDLHWAEFLVNNSYIDRSQWCIQ